MEMKTLRGTCLSFVKWFEACADAAALGVSGMVECVRQRERDLLKQRHF